MQGYHGLAEETAAAITPDGWLRTGDLVAIRDDGQLEIRDRLKELIKVKGASVAPAEIELVLRQHPAVRDAGVVGVPDAERGEAPIAFVDARRAARSPTSSRTSPPRAWPPTSARARSWSSTRCRALPTGKLLRRALRERASRAPSSAPAAASGRDPSASSSSSAKVTSSMPSRATWLTRSADSWLRSVPLARLMQCRPLASNALASEPPPLRMRRGV